MTSSPTDGDGGNANANANAGDLDPNRLHTGRVKFFAKRRGFGFIVPAGGGPDVFAHQEHIKMDGYRYLVPREVVHYRLGHDENREGNKWYATEIYKEGSLEVLAATSRELEAAVHDATLEEADAIGAALDADAVAESLDAAQRDESTMTVGSAAEVAEVEAAAIGVEEEAEDLAARVLPVVAVEQIAAQLEEDQRKAAAEAEKETAKVTAASQVDKTHPDPFHHLKSMFGL